MMGKATAFLLVALLSLFAHFNNVAGREEGLCSIDGDVHYNPFDSLASRYWITFQGTCLYLLSGKKPGANSNVPAFEVMGLNEHRNGNTKVSYLNSIIIKWGEGAGVAKVIFHKVNLEDKTGGFVNHCPSVTLGILPTDVHVACIAGQSVIPNTNVTVRCPGVKVMVLYRLDGFHVCYDGNACAGIHVPPSYSKQLNGICGNYNGNSDDDATTRDGTQINIGVVGLEEASILVGQSYKVTNSVDSPKSCQESRRKKRQTLEEVENDPVCDLLSYEEAEHSDEYLAKCFSDYKVLVEKRHKKCNFDVFHGGLKTEEQKQKAACDHLGMLVSECEHHMGKHIGKWRYESKCEHICPDTFVFSKSTSRCPHTCAKPNTDCHISKEIEACVCPDGKYQLGAKCVPKSECKCLDNHHNEREVSSTWLSHNCRVEHKCEANFRVTKHAHSCPSGTKCERSSGHAKCVPSSKECKDTLSKKNPFEIFSANNVYQETATSCARIVGCNVGLCRTLGGPGGACCASCKDVGDANCMDGVSPCYPQRFTDKNGKQSAFSSCYTMIKHYPELCKENVVKRRCCKACKEGLANTKVIRCVNSATVKIAKGKRQITCAKIARSASKLRKCCTKNWKGFKTPMRCSQICCGSCDGPF